MEVQTLVDSDVCSLMPNRALYSVANGRLINAKLEKLVVPCRKKRELRKQTWQGAHSHNGAETNFQRNCKKSCSIPKTFPEFVRFSYSLILSSLSFSLLSMSFLSGPVLFSSFPVFWPGSQHRQIARAPPLVPCSLCVLRFSCSFRKLVVVCWRFLVAGVSVKCRIQIPLRRRNVGVE